MPRWRNEHQADFSMNERNVALQTGRKVSIFSSSDEEFGKTIATTYLTELAMNAANVENQAVQLEAVNRFRELLCHKCPPIDEIIATGILPILVQGLSRVDNPTLQLQSVWALTNIAAGNSAQTKRVVDASAVPPLLQLLKPPHDDVCITSLEALGNIIADGPVLRDIVIEQGLVKPLLSFIKPNVPVPILRKVTRVIKYLCGSNDPPVKVIQEILPPLNKLITHKNKDIIVDTLCVVVSYLKDGDDNNYRIQMIIESGIVPKLIPLLSHGDREVKADAIRVIGNIVAGTDEQTQVVLDYYALSHFPSLLTRQVEEIYKGTLWVLSNILSGNVEQVQTVIDAGLLPSIVEKLHSSGFRTQHEALRAVTNLIRNGTKEQVGALIDCGVITPLCNLLSCEDTEAIYNVAESLYNMLEKAGENAHQLADSIQECGGLDKIEQLQSHDNVEIHEKVYNILVQYCGGDGVRRYQDKFIANTRIETLQTQHSVLISHCTNEEEIERTLASADLEILVRYAANADNPAVQLAAVRQCRKLLSCGQRPMFIEILATNSLPILIQCLSRADNPTLQYESAWAIIEITCGDSTLINKLLEAGAVSVFLELLESPHENVCERALILIGCMVADKPALRDYMIELGFLNSLLSFMKPNKPVSILRTVGWLIGNLFRRSDLPPPVKFIQEILPPLNTLIMHNDTNIQEDIVWAIAYVSYVGNDQIQMVIDSGIVPNLITLLSHKSSKVQSAALSTLIIIATGTEEHRQVVLDCGALSHMPALLSHQSENICKEAVWFLANVLSGNEQQVQAVFDAGLLPRIVEILERGQFYIQKLAVRAVGNISKKGTKEQVAALVDYGIIPTLYNLLCCKNTETVDDVLEGLRNILEKAGEKLNNWLIASRSTAKSTRSRSVEYVYENIDIFKKSYNILNQYDAEDEEEPALKRSRQS